MRSPVIVRPARREDAEAISRFIVATLRATNAKDYSEAVILRVERSFSPAAVLGLLERRLVFVATLEGRVVGTAGLEGDVVRTVFVEPDHQGRGVGRGLMERIGQAATERGVTVLTVPSSITAEAFYARMGFRAVRDSHHGEERTIIMERRLSGTG